LYTSSQPKVNNYLNFIRSNNLLSDVYTPISDEQIRPIRGHSIIMQQNSNGEFLVDKNRRPTNLTRQDLINAGIDRNTATYGVHEYKKPVQPIKYIKPSGRDLQQQYDKYLKPSSLNNFNEIKEFEDYSEYKTALSLYNSLFGNSDYPLAKPTFKKNPEIIAKQKQLKEAGLYSGELDGIWGPKSEEAWKTFNSSSEIKSVETPPTEVLKTLPKTTTKPNIKNVYSEQIYVPGTNPMLGNTQYDYRYVVEQEDGSLLELANEEQYSKFKQNYGFENNLPVRYGRIPQFRNTPVLQTYKNGGVVSNNDAYLLEMLLGGFVNNY
jgi:hypothetical protein